MAGKRTPIISRTITATGTEDHVYIKMKNIKFLKVDGIHDVTFGIDVNTTHDDAFTLKSGEYIDDFNVRVGTLYYKATGNASSFRILGERE